MSRKKQRREVEIFNLSFLDVVSCGFGAIILLLIIVQFGEPVVIEKLSVDMSGQVLKLEQELFDIRGETRVLNRDLKARQEQLSIQREKLARLRGSLSTIKGEFANARSEAETQAIIEGQLQSAQQSLTAEMRRLQQGALSRPKVNNRIGGLPVDSEYIIFIIDTSGSMTSYAWSHVLKKVSEVLSVYPKVKGIQVMNDMGQYMFPTYKGKWIPDTVGRRTAINTRLRTWQPFSNSSPVEGIEAAIKRFYAKDKSISLYIFGDDFSSGSIEQVVTTVARLNRVNSSGKHRVRIHAMGFPVLFQVNGMSANVVRFAALMRKLAENNDGTFVGLNSTKP
ncbi:MAG: VWA domain-containing protein [Proteobacteria bacterium]|nr:VWA domain-containing protein [Pseudomonadota bacterium]